MDGIHLFFSAEAFPVVLPSLTILSSDVFRGQFDSPMKLAVFNRLVDIQEPADRGSIDNVIQGRCSEIFEFSRCLIKPSKVALPTNTRPEVKCLIRFNVGCFTRLVSVSV